MKYTTLVMALATIGLTACQTAPTKAPEPVVRERIVEKVVLKEPTSVVMSNIPDWMNKLPKENGYMFASGTARSQDYSMAVEKAKTVAQSKLAELLGVKVDKQTRIYQSDKNGSYYESSSTAIRKSVEEITMVGAEVAETKVVMEAPGMYRAYILMTIKGEEQKQAQAPALPTDDDEEKKAFEQLGKKKVSAVQQQPVTAKSEQHVEPVVAKTERVETSGVIVRPVAMVDKGTMIVNTISDQGVKDRVAQVMKDPNAVVINTTIR
jgi:transcriptional antiterminator Rof (Rho-off)